MLLAFVVPGRARGQSPPDENASAIAEAPKETPKEKAQRLLQEGFQHLDEGESAAALGYFRDAYATFPRANLLLNIASALRQLGKNAESASVYRRYLTDPDASNARREQVERILREIALVVGMVRIAVGSADATVLLDGQSVSGGAVRLVEVDIGPHTVIAIIQGKPRAVETVHVFAGREASLVLRLEKEAPPRFVVVKEGLPPIQIAGFLLSALGVVGIGAGTGFGIAALKDTRDIQVYCSRDLTICTPEAEKLTESATFKARFSTGAFVVGGSAALLGTAFLVLGRRNNTRALPRPIAEVRMDGFQLGVMGTW